MPAGRRCRFSDAALVQSNGDQAVGYIARTTSRGRYSGSLTISASNPHLSFTSQSGVAFPGTQVEKVGRTTGWTYGPVTSFCADVNVSGTDITLFCQTLVDAGGAGGDSGSPVFAWDGGYYGLATLHGILWGVNSSGNVFVFSTIGNVERELGCLHAFGSDGTSPTARADRGSGGPRGTLNGESLAGPAGLSFVDLVSRTAGPHTGEPLPPHDAAGDPDAASALLPGCARFGPVASRRGARVCWERRARLSANFQVPAVSRPAPWPPSCTSTTSRPSA